MKKFIILSVLYIQLTWAYGAPAGAGSFAYSDSAGNRYGGTYPINEGDYYDPKDYQIPYVQNNPKDYQIPYVQNNPKDYQIPYVQNSYQDPNTFFPDYFRNFENLIQEIVAKKITRHGSKFRRAFSSDYENQRKALDAASKAYDLTSNQAGYYNNFAFRSPFSNFGFGGFPFPTFDMSQFTNAAFAGGRVMPGFHHQIAAISPANPDMPNVNVMRRFGEESNPNPRSNFVSMSSSSFASSSNVNGKEVNSRGAETTINDNGKVTRYSVRN